MKKAKKSTESFQVLNTVQMDKIKGGQWVEVTNPDGTKKFNLGLMIMIAVLILFVYNLSVRTK